MHTWHWHSWQELPYLSCSLLSQFAHGFFTQQFSSHSLEDMTKILHQEASVYRLKQVHGNEVLTPREIEYKLSLGGDEVEQVGDTILAKADGLIGEQPLQAVWTASADCTPALIGDVKTGQVAAVHAGWRGTAKKIIPQAISRMQSQGSKLQDLRIAMGPAISGEVYQVSEDVAIQLASTLIPEEDKKAIINALQELDNSPLFPDSEPGKVRIDVRQVSALQMEQLGISPEQISLAPYCTYQNPENFFSHRRAKQGKVQWSGIVSMGNGV
ncbi:MAG: peptidoglycan editing factor PgeF [Richelia sp. SM1_7_0]|nr:peptidoglycan editing factor PgeF [Richelia sp. SM1_7_0]